MARIPTSLSASGLSRVACTVSLSPGQPGAEVEYPRERKSSSQGCHALEWIQRPWMNITGVGWTGVASDMFLLREGPDSAEPAGRVGAVEQVLQGRDEPAVDREIGSGHVLRAIAGQQQHQM